MFSLRYLDTLPTAVVDELQSLISQVNGFLRVSFNDDGTIIGSTPLLNVVPVGAVKGWLTSVPPAGYVLLDGSQKSRITYKALFELWGPAGVIGPGDGSTTFTLPDMRGRFFLGKSAAGTGSVLGETGGLIDHVHSGGTFSGSTGSATATISGTTAAETSHTHSFSATATAHSGFFAVNADTNGDGVTTQVSAAGHTHSVSGTTGAGSSHSHGVGSLSVDGHLHSVGTLAISASGSANPPFLAGNWIAFAGV